MNKKLIVTGGLGFIGSHFVRMALERGYFVINIDKQTYAAGKGLGFKKFSNYRFIKEDICNLTRLPSEADHIVNFAAESHVDRSIDEPADFLRTNVLGTGVLLSVALEYWSSLSGKARNNFRFLHISTDEVYGSLGPNGAFTEITPYSPNSPYAATKAASDHLVRAWHKTYGLPVLISNCSNNYGPYQFPEKLIPLMILNALEGKPLPVYGDGHNVRDWLYVTDHCEALFTLLEKGCLGETYNVGGKAEKTNLEVVKTICDMLDEIKPQGESYHRQISFVKDRPGHDERYAMNISKIRSELGWKPATSFEKGIRNTIQWYLENEVWWRRTQKGIYQQERLGLS